ncbi:class I SAM-dependent methyltransferase family protein [Halogeometricum borinquense]|uniref:Class I SAM-dependent methyltransferase family protein n=1 Tax=Halogeometricum borinquense TaxID=60847 RepID=A0A6C0UH20_9EURY|nr:class I SAM-dependent methyltransferase family protein [Halogeometricum borinquense]QIB73561.1 class I SAM-dependent methyltransferase family protein [Halogeometricum borinquense]QIQ77084.1 class I SAM-dependent methyltransferase family protein [Halogeometricum borinquense]
MNVPCVRVSTDEGEATRRALADRDLVDQSYEITVHEGTLYIPVTDASAVEDEYEVVSFDVESRETQTMPADILGFEPTYERLGDVVILDEDDAERASRIADAIAESDLRAETVVNRASKVKGELRVRDWDILVDDTDEELSADDQRLSAPSTETVHREYGCEFLLDIAEVYFSPRLATERHRVVQQVTEDERVFDMFAGVGPFVIPMAKRGAEVVGCDLNAAAVEYLRENVRRNGVEERVTARQGDVRDVADDYEGWADRIVMNLPHSADDFLDTAVRLAGEECVLHYYDIQHEDDPFGPGIEAIREAAEPQYDVRVDTERVVRSYAPHEYNVCVDVTLTAR